MKLVIQRVKWAKVSIDDEVVGKIRQGLMVLFGAMEGDDEKKADYLAKKLSGLRVFSDENGKMNLSLNDVNGGILSVSQFTLYADCKKGNRPSFIKSGDPKRAEELYDYFNRRLLENGVAQVEKGVFGADMQVDLCNDGPFTIILE